MVITTPRPLYPRERHGTHNTGVLVSPQPDLLPDVFCLMVRIFRLMLVLIYIYIYIYSTNIPPIMIINRIYETQNLLSLFPSGRTKDLSAPLYNWLGRSQGRSGKVRKLSPPQGFDPRTFQPLASHYCPYLMQS